jgi:DNA-binding NarL/FixJ family response regulator
MEMPVMNGGQVATYMKEKHPKVKILAVSAYDDWHYIHGMLENGAAGYITKEEVPTILITAIRSIASGKNGWISSKIAGKVSKPAS